MKEIFDEVLATIENDDIREFTKNAIDKIDNWFYVAPAASSGRHHPRTSLGEGGLARHSVSVVRFLNYILEPETIHDQFTSRERDLMRVAALFHDTKKSGNQEDYELNPQTRFEHPLLAADFIRSMSGLPKNELDFCADIISTHMGQFNTSKRSEIILPKPQDKYQILVHLCDYISSRRDVEVRTDMIPEYKDPSTMERMPKESAVELPTVDTYKLDFGKHAGKTIPEIHKEDRGWLYWAKNNVTREPFATLIKEFKPKETTNE